MKFKKYRDSSGRLTVSLEDLPSYKYRYVRWLICRKFDLEKGGEYIKMVDQKFQEFSCNELRLSIDWDIWFGFTVTALSKESEFLVQKIGGWMKSRYS